MKRAGGKRGGRGQERGLREEAATGERHGRKDIPRTETLSNGNRRIGRPRDDYRANGLFRAAAARMSFLNAPSLIFSPSWKSMARLMLPSRLELNSFEGSS